MDDDSKRKRKIIFIVLAVMAVIVLVAPIWRYMNKVNEDSIEVTPNKFFCPLGKTIDTPDVIKLENVYEVYHQEYDLGEMIVGDLLEVNTTLDLVNTMYGIMKDSIQKKDSNAMEQIEVPSNHCYIGSIDKPPAYTDQSFISGFDFDLLHMDMQLFAWNTSYKLNSGKEGSETHLVMILNEKVVYGKIKKLGNTKMQMDIKCGIKQ